MSTELMQKGGHLNVGDIIEILDEKNMEQDSFYGLTAECVESDGHPEFPCRCTVRLKPGMEHMRNVIDEKGEYDHIENEEDLPLIYEDYWPQNYRIISRATTT